MADVTYPECIRELYESEVLGEVLSLALYEAAKNDRDRYHHGTLLQLETETQAKLRPFLYKYGIALSKEVDPGPVADLIASYKQNSWREFASNAIPAVSHFLNRFKEIAAAGPQEDQEILQSMVKHEASILRWLEMEAAGETEGSLDAIIEQLRFPLPPPAS